LATCSRLGALRRLPHGARWSAGQQRSTGRYERNLSGARREPRRRIGTFRRGSGMRGRCRLRSRHLLPCDGVCTSQCSPCMPRDHVHEDVRAPFHRLRGRMLLSIRSV
jgi:hypothetical protein